MFVNYNCMSHICVSRLDAITCLDWIVTVFLTLNPTKLETHQFNFCFVIADVLTSNSRTPPATMLIKLLLLYEMNFILKKCFRKKFISFHAIEVFKRYQNVTKYPVDLGLIISFKWMVPAVSLIAPWLLRVTQLWFHYVAMNVWMHPMLCCWRCPDVKHQGISGNNPDLVGTVL